MKLGLDTNLLVRYITDDDPDQADQLEALFASFQSENVVFLINEVVLAELDWVLTHVYNFSKKDFLLVIDRLFETGDIAFHTPNLVKKACKLYADGKADFSDCYLSIINKNAGYDTTYTLDKKASELSSFTLLR